MKWLQRIFSNSAPAGEKTSAQDQLVNLKWKLKTKWRETYGMGFSSILTAWTPSIPTVADGIVYFGAQDGDLYAVDSKTGQVKWKFWTYSLSGPASSPSAGRGISSADIRSVVCAACPLLDQAGW